MGSSRSDRAVSPVVANVLLVAVVVILAATVSVFALGFAEETTKPGPVVGQSSGTLEANTVGDGNGIVRLTHVAGDRIPVPEMEVAVDATDACGKKGRLVNLPVDRYSGKAIGPGNIEGDDIFDERSYNSGGTPDENAIHGSEYTASDQIAFRIPDTDCTIEEGEEITVRVVHTPTASVPITKTLTATSQ
ncbi:type IV pilin [Halomicrobium sp. IBSBa]|uniref:type IV pilin n=1 Tax=unclassified Halomicrobium TaxID=2610901 RepID=UPI001ABF2B44|nr:type IV pilin [Halomicrobium sp. IBSBa]MBO4249350.1 type IV pilin [Halomicrobium sp. IBSBa]